MHADDLPDDVPRENLRWMELKVRVLVNVSEPYKGIWPFLQAAYEIEQLSMSGGQEIGACPAGHVITKDEAETGECGWCEAAAEEWAERRYDR